MKKLQYLAFVVLFALVVAAAFSAVDSGNEGLEVRVFFTWTAQDIFTGAGIPVQRELHECHALVIDPGREYNVLVQVHGDQDGSNQSYLVTLKMYHCSSTLICGQENEVEVVTGFDSKYGSADVYVAPLEIEITQYLHVELVDIKSQPV